MCMDGSVLKSVLGKEPSDSLGWYFVRSLLQVAYKFCSQKKDGWRHDIMAQSSFFFPYFDLTMQYRIS